MRIVSALLALLVTSSALAEGDVSVGNSIITKDYASECPGGISLSLGETQLTFVPKDVFMTYQVYEVEGLPGRLMRSTVSFSESLWYVEMAQTHVATDDQLVFAWIDEFRVFRTGDKEFSESGWQEDFSAECLDKNEESRPLALLGFPEFVLPASEKQ